MLLTSFNLQFLDYFFPLCQKKTCMSTVMHLKVECFFCLGGGVRIFIFLFHLIYIYECICIWVWGSTIPPLSRSPHLYSDLTPLLSRISPSSPSLPIPASAQGVLLASPLPQKRSENLNIGCAIYLYRNPPFG